MVALYPRLDATATSQVKLLPASECDALALRFADRRELPLEPTVAYRFGTGFVLYQPVGGQQTMLLISSSHELLAHTTSFQ